MSDITITTPQSFWAHLYQLAAAAWRAIVSADAEVKMITAEHPEIVAAAQTLKAMAPPQIVAGLNVAEQVAQAANNIIEHVGGIAVPVDAISAPVV